MTKNHENKKHITNNYTNYEKPLKITTNNINLQYNNNLNHENYQNLK